MVMRVVTILSLFINIAFFQGSFCAQGATNQIQDKIDRDVILGNLLKSRLEFYHYSRPKLGEETSNLAFKFFIERLDGGKQFLLQEDILALEKYRTQMTETLKSGEYPLMIESTKLYQSRIKQIIQFVENILKKPFTFDVDEYLEYDIKKRKFATTTKELEENWRKILKYSTLNNYITMLDYEKKNAKIIKLDPVLEKKSREKVLKNYLRMLKRIQLEDHNDELDRYFNAISMAIDPHTNYFPPKKKKQFDVEISNQLEGIGALLGPDGDFVKVVQIIVGSPSWKQKELEPEDIIIKVGQGDNEPVDVVNMPVDDVVDLVRGKKGTTVKLTVKKPNGMVKVVSLVREVIKVEEAFAKSAVLKLDNTKENIGYIYLPKFYRDFDANSQDRPSRNCSDDVRAELIKLKKQKIDGLILDLRDNAGGALLDAEFMSGLFVHGGPIVQIKFSNNSIEVMRDEDKEIEYSGKLIILVNRLSASASEILAAALQDYKRALIVGPPHSYGKGTVQEFMNLDRGIHESYEKYLPLGALKITTQKYYRITGGSTQFHGVKADVILPDPYAHLEFGEQSLENALPWDEVSGVKFTPWRTTEFPKVKLQQLTNSRINSHKAFKNIIENSKRMKEHKDQSLQTLHLQKALAEQKTLEEESDAYRNEELNEKIQVWTEKSNWVSGVDKEYIKELEEKKLKKKKGKDLDELDEELNLKQKLDKVKLMKAKQQTREDDINKDWIRSLRIDPFIEETLHIMRDFIKLDDVKPKAAG